jgi:hypothetical protein
VVTMSLPGPMLDYASPRPQGKLRLPAKSQLEMRLDGDQVIVREWLQAKTGAMIAVAFSLIPMVSLPLSVLGVLSYRDPIESRIAVVTFVAFFWISEIVVLLLVINSTWRQTVLRARKDGLLLTFSVPFGQRRHEWNAGEIENIQMNSTTTVIHKNHLGEIQIHIAGQPLVSLFTDHAATELEPVVAALRQAVGLSDKVQAQP